MHVTLFGNKVFTDTTKALKMRSSWVGLQSNDWYPYQRKERRDLKHREEGHEKTEAEIAITQTQAKERQGLPAATRS